MKILNDIARPFRLLILNCSLLINRSVFLVFVQKEFYHIFRDKRTMLILLGMPVVQLILFGFAITNEVKNAKIVIFDPSKDDATQRIARQLDASQYFTVVRYVNNQQELKQSFQDGNIGMAVVFGERFNENLLHTGKAQLRTTCRCHRSEHGNSISAICLLNYWRLSAGVDGAKQDSVPDTARSEVAV